ncbi:MAG: LuxR C-terminal-related transcriptional regulator [Solirubrobacteraceae bacterium]
MGNRGGQQDASAATVDGTDTANDVPTLRRAASAVASRLADRLGDTEAATDLALLVELGAELELRQQREFDRRAASLRSVQAGLARLRSVDSAQRLFEQVPVELCGACGFARAVLFRVDGSRMVVESVHVDGDREAADAFLAYAKDNDVDLREMLPETEMMRRRAPAIIEDARRDRTAHRPTVEAFDVRSYVSSPVMPDGRVIGFLHADHGPDGRKVDPVDRDTLFAFAEGFGYALQRTVLRERLHAQRVHLRRLLDSTERTVDALCDADIEMVGVGEQVVQDHPRAVPSLMDEPRVSVLTPRELEVLRHVAVGATNNQIAERLVVSEGTVRTHVKHILRKLHAANRTEAVARYARLRQTGD